MKYEAGTRVRFTTPGDTEIPEGTLGTVIADEHAGAFNFTRVEWDGVPTNFLAKQFGARGHLMEWDEIEKAEDGV